MLGKFFVFQRVIAACEQGDREAWRGFLVDYTPLVLQLCNFYLSLPPQSRDDLWREVLKEITANNFDLLRNFDHREEQQFLVDLRSFLLDRGALRLDAAETSAEIRPPAIDEVEGLLNNLPAVHQEVLFLKLCGYSDATLEKMLRVTPTVAQKALERLRENYSVVLGRAEDRCLWPEAWATVTRIARSSKKEDCPTLHQFTRIHDGHVSWYEKEPVERHVASCLHCLEAWAALREVKYWRYEVKSSDQPTIESFLDSLPHTIKSKQSGTFLKRVFG